MKKHLYLVLLLSAFGFSQNGISYQALILNPSGEQLPGQDNINAPISNKLVCLKFAIIDHTNQIEYLETHKVSTDTYGIVNLIIGTGDQIGGYASNFSNIVWGNNAKSLKVDLDVNANCTYFVEISNQPFTYIPFAYYAANSGNANVQDATTTVNGIIRLGGDLVGPGTTANAPIISNNAIVSAKISNGAVTPIKIAPGSNNTVLVTDNSGNVTWLDSATFGLNFGLVGPVGPQGPAGVTGATGSQGPAGTNGTNGADGSSAYQLAVANGFVGTQTQWLGSLVGAQGPAGVAGATGSQGIQGLTGSQGPAGTNGTNGADGSSAYQLAVANGFVGTQAQWLTSLVGAQGPAGATGLQGIQGLTGSQGPSGADGSSAYQLAVANGFVGTQAQWLASLVGAQGPAGVTGATGSQGIQGLTGPQGSAGTNGVDGSSAYQLAVANGFVGTEVQWLASLVGAQGPAGVTGATGSQGIQGLTGPQGSAGTNGVDGSSAYQLAVANGFVGTEVQWLASLVGAQGPAGVTGVTGSQGIQGLTGPQGPTGTNGADGSSAYQLAVANGFVGTEVQWLASLVGAQGPAGVSGATGSQGPAGTNGVDGSSAYQLAVANGFVGTESQWLASLVGAQGIQGIAGTNATVTGSAPIDVTSGVVSLNDSGVTSVKIANDAVTTSKIADASVTGAKLNQMTATSGQVLKWNGTSWAPSIDTDTNTTYTGSTSTVLNGTSFERAALTGDVTAAANSNTTTIANDAVTSAKILDGTITSVDLSATAGITNGQLANNSVTINGSNVALGGSTTITASPTNSTLDSTNLWVGNVTNQATAVAMSGDATMSNSGAVTIANDAVTSAKILDGTITSVDLSATAGITNGQLANNSVTINGSNVALGGSTTITASPTNSTLDSTNLWVGNVTNQATAVAMSGDATMSNSGTVTIANDAVTSAKILDGTIATEDVANSAITGVKLENNIALPGTASMILPSGTTAQRPATPAAGMSRYNTTDNIMEYFNGTSWVRSIPGSSLITTNSNIILTETYSVVRINTASANVTVTLPVASTALNRIYSIIKSDASSNKLIFNTSITASGYSFTEANIQGEYKIQSDGTNWYLVN